MNNNNNETLENTDNEPTEQIVSEPIIAVFLHNEQFYISTPEEVTQEYYHSLITLLLKVHDDTPQLFENIKDIINNKDFTAKIN